MRSGDPSHLPPHPLARHGTRDVPGLSGASPRASRSSPGPSGPSRARIDPRASQGPSLAFYCLVVSTVDSPLPRIYDCGGLGEADPQGPLPGLDRSDRALTLARESEAPRGLPGSETPESWGCRVYCWVGRSGEAGTTILATIESPELASPCTVWLGRFVEAGEARHDRLRSGRTERTEPRGAPGRGSVGRGDPSTPALPASPRAPQRA